MTNDSGNVQSDEKGFIPAPGNEDEGKTAPLTQDVTPDAEQAAQPIEVAATEPNDAKDVPAALERKDTADGPGFDSEDELPESNFAGFAEDDVEDDNQ